MTITTLSPSPISVSVRRRYLAGNARAQPSAPISPAFPPPTQIPRRDITLPPTPGATDTTVAALARPPSQSGIEQSNQTRALNPHSPTAPLVQTPAAVSSLEAFPTPASVHPHASVSGRHPKTLNGSGHYLGSQTRPAGFHLLDFDTTIAAVNTRPAPPYPRGTETATGSPCDGSRLGFGATPRRSESTRWISRAIMGAERIASPGARPTTVAAIQTAQHGRLSIVCSPPSN
jgi:hypothetical protein